MKKFVIAIIIASSIGIDFAQKIVVVGDCRFIFCCSIDSEIFFTERNLISDSVEYYRESTNGMGPSVYVNAKTIEKRQELKYPEDILSFMGNNKPKGFNKNQLVFTMDDGSFILLKEWRFLGDIRFLAKMSDSVLVSSIGKKIIIDSYSEKNAEYRIVITNGYAKGYIRDKTTGKLTRMPVLMENCRDGVVVM